MLFIVLVVVAVAAVRGSDIDSNTDSESYLKQAKLDFGSSHEVGAVALPHSHSHETGPGYYDSDGGAVAPAGSTSEAPRGASVGDIPPQPEFDSDHRKLHSEFDRHFLNHNHDLDHDFGKQPESHDFGISPGFKDEGTEDIDKNIEELFIPNGENDDRNINHAVETLGPDFNLDGFTTEVESGKGKAHEGADILVSSHGFKSSIGVNNFHFKNSEFDKDLQAKYHQDSFKARMSQGSLGVSLESFNVHTRDGREEHNLRDLHQQRASNNEYLDVILADNRRRFDSEAEYRGTFSNSGTNTGSRNHFERRDVSDDNVPHRRRNGDKRRHNNRDSQSGELYRKTDCTDMSADNTEAPKDRLESRGHGLRHSINERTEPQEREGNTNDTKTGFSIPAATNTNNTKRNKDKTHRDRTNQGPETKTRDENTPYRSNTDPRKDQRPIFKTTTDNEVLRPKERTNDGQTDMWIWSGEGEKGKERANGSESEGSRVRTTTEAPDLDDRAAFVGDKCPTGKVKFGSQCVDSD